MQTIGENVSVQKMYSEVSPYPGRFIKLLKEKNVLRKRFYTSLARKFEFNQGEAYGLFSSQDRFGKFCPSSQAKIKILDVGCGTGEVSLQLGLAFPNAHVTAVDNSPGSLSWAEKLKEYFQIANVRFLQRNFDEESLVDLGTFDMIHCSGVLHHVKNPERGLLHISEVMKRNESILWIFLYGNFGRHLENIIRKGIRMVYPDDNLLQERADLACDLGFDRSDLSMMGPYAVRNAKITRSILKYKRSFDEFRCNLMSLWYRSYTRRLENTDTFDAFAHPIVRYYDAQMVRQLAEVADLDLVSYWFYPHNSRTERKILPMIEDKDIYYQMETMESFHYPQSLYLNFKRK